MKDNIKLFLLNMIKLPILLIGYIVLILLSIVLPKKWISRIFQIVHIERDIIEIFNNKLYLKTFAFLLTVIVFILYKVS